MALKVSIEGLRFRASDGRLNAVDQLRILQQRLNGSAGITRIRAGDNPKALSGYLAHRQPAAETKIEAIKISTLKAAKVKTIEVPEVIDDPRLPFKVMKGELTVGLFKQVMQDYKITGHRADELKAILADPSRAGDALSFVSLIDARKIAKRLSDITGRKFRVPTEKELLK